MNPPIDLNPIDSCLGDLEFGPPLNVVIVRPITRLTMGSTGDRESRAAIKLHSDWVFMSFEPTGQPIVGRDSVDHVFYTGHHDPFCGTDIG